MNVLVTGATGFIGSQVVRALREGGNDVRATFRPTSLMDRVTDHHEAVEWVECDLTRASTGELAEVATGVDACVHAAWFVEPGEYLRSRANLEWVESSLRLLEGLADAGCRRAVYVGTCFEYDPSFGYLTESTPARPWSLYGSAKLSTCLMGGELARALGVEFAWARLFYQYGPYEPPGRLVPYVIRTLLAGEGAELTEGRQIRDFLHVEDVGSALAAVVRSDHVGPVNVGSGEPVSVRELVTRIARELDAEDRVRFGARPESPGDPPFICAGNECLREKVGWSPRYGLEEGIRNAVEWWRVDSGSPV